MYTDRGPLNQDTEKYIYTQDEGSNRKLEKVAYEEPSTKDYAPMALLPTLSLLLLFIEVSSSHRIRHMIGLLWTSDQPVAENLHRTTQ
jgi:hypothetical protein